MTLNISCRVTMATSSCTDKVHCLRVTMIISWDTDKTYKLARWIVLWNIKKTL